MNNITYKKRKGFALVLALIVVAVGLVIIAAMFNYASQFTGFFSEFRKAYIDTVTARSYIEHIKGEIVADNIARGSVIHGPGNDDPTFPVNHIKNLDGLLIKGIEGKENKYFINDTFEKLNGPQRIEVRVYDANYSVKAIDTSTFTIDELYELPPSFYAETELMPDWVDETKDNTDYNEFEETRDYRGVYETYGAYLIKVRIYDTARTSLTPENRPPMRLVRTTEEAFLQVLPVN
jgi:hypothetical protein